MSKLSVICIMKKKLLLTTASEILKVCPFIQWSLHIISPYVECFQVFYLEECSYTVPRFVLVSLGWQGGR